MAIKLPDELREHRFCREEKGKKASLLLRMSDGAFYTQNECIVFSRCPHTSPNLHHIQIPAQSILQEQIKNLSFLNKSRENIEIIIKQITEMKKHAHPFDKGQIARKGIEY